MPAVLQAAHRPMAVNEIATRVGLHPNTTRFHLDGLVEQDLAERATERRDEPGRPRALYTATRDSPRAGRHSYRLLAVILASYLAAPSSRAGPPWSPVRRGPLPRRPARPFRRVDSAAAIEQLAQALDEIGFAPEAVTAGHERKILLHHCPFREAAEEHRDVVCSVHLGPMRGMLAELDAPVDATSLDPFVEPDVCVAHPTARPMVAGASAQ